MPKFEIDTTAEIDVDIDDFLSECSRRELEELANALINDGWIKKIGGKLYLSGGPEKTSLYEKEFNEALDKIQSSYNQIIKEDLEIIIALAKKYRY